VDVDDTLRSPDVPPHRYVPSMPIPVLSFDSAQYIAVFYASFNHDKESPDARSPAARPTATICSGSSALTQGQVRFTCPSRTRSTLIISGRTRHLSRT